MFFNQLSSGWKCDHDMRPERRSEQGQQAKSMILSAYASLTLVCSREWQLKVASVTGYQPDNLSIKGPFRQVSTIISINDISTFQTSLRTATSKLRACLFLRWGFRPFSFAPHIAQLPQSIMFFKTCLVSLLAAMAIAAPAKPVAHELNSRDPSLSYGVYTFSTKTCDPASKSTTVLHNLACQSLPGIGAVPIWPTMSGTDIACKLQTYLLDEFGNVPLFPPVAIT